MHRDIKLDNIGIVESKPPRAVILDFGHATPNQESSNHMRGTVRYLAPEVIALKKDSKSPPYDKGADVWALGICVFELLWGHLIPWQQVDENGYRWFHEELDSIQKTVAGEHITLLDNVIRSTAAWERENRLSAAEEVDVLGGDPLSPLGSNMPKGGKRSRESE